MWPEPGGVLRYGIPNFKMNKELLESKLSSLQKLGINFVNNTKIGVDITLKELHLDHGYDVIFIGTGAGVGNLMRLEGEELQHVYQATDFLVRGNLKPYELPPGQQEQPYIGKNVVVVGGGDTSMDCVRTAIRLGAERVICVYRRTENEMLGRAEERIHAKEEGVKFLYLTTPVRFIGDENGQVKQVELCLLYTSDAADE